MDYTTLLQSIQNLGIGIVAVLAVCYLLWQVIKANKSVLDKTMEMQGKNQEYFVSFINENNHQKSDMIKEHTEAMMSVKNSIEANTNIIKSLIESRK